MVVTLVALAGLRLATHDAPQTVSLERPSTTVAAEVAPTTHTTAVTTTSAVPTTTTAPMPVTTRAASGPATTRAPGSGSRAAAIEASKIPTGPPPTAANVAYVAPTVTASRVVSCTPTAPGGWKLVYSLTFAGGQGWTFPGDVVVDGLTGTWTATYIAPADPPPPPYTKDWTIGSVWLYRTVDHGQVTYQLPTEHVIRAHCTA